ncbi:MAG: hypothetical protein QNK37_31515 [Acidobacteriota bacterium]|nr:hypothetical protein [Acidobacteriota bacterium]
MFTLVAMLLSLGISADGAGAMDAMNEISQDYVKLVLGMGRHDADYVDAYYGPEEWRKEAERAALDLATIIGKAGELSKKLAELDTSSLDAMGKQRHLYLTKQIKALTARAEWLSGKKMTFDQEAERLYDVKPPEFGEDHFKKLAAELEKALPGEGSLTTRLEAYRKRFIIPPDKLDKVFKAAIEEARERTGRHMELPSGESFVVEYVTDKAWSGYNWYKGKAHSLIQVNTDFPITIDRAVDLACHEGYPGHHVYNALLEKHMVTGRGWLEFSVYPLFSPQSLIAEGSANFGIDVAFPGEERMAFEREVLFPLAGLDPAGVDEYYRIMELVRKLSYAGNEAARNYLNGTWDREKTIQWLVDYALFSRDRAGQRLKFISKYRAYVINYNLGQDMVAAWVNAQGGTADQSAERWKVFERLLSGPMLPSNLEL